VDFQFKVFLRKKMGNVPKVNSNRSAGSQEQNFQQITAWVPKEFTLRYIFL
jgi:hypothetical protein